MGILKFRGGEILVLRGRCDTLTRRKPHFNITFVSPRFLGGNSLCLGAENPDGLRKREKFMAQPFLRIDLSNQAKDFQNTVIEAGWPLLDKSNTNYQILRKWLGGAVAEPERQRDEVLFYLRSDSGRGSISRTF